MGTRFPLGAETTKPPRLIVLETTFLGGFVLAFTTNRAEISTDHSVKWKVLLSKRQSHQPRVL